MRLRDGSLVNVERERERLHNHFTPPSCLFTEICCKFFYFYSLHVVFGYGYFVMNVVLFNSSLSQRRFSHTPRVGVQEIEK